MRRNVWTLDELLALLRGVAQLGGDARTLAAIAEALGVRAMVKGGEHGDVSGFGGMEWPGGRGASDTGQRDAGRNL